MLLVGGFIKYQWSVLHREGIHSKSIRKMSFCRTGEVCTSPEKFSDIKRLLMTCDMSHVLMLMILHNVL